jgi:pimeloyl-ACP methyl ester carboxylesterase
MENGGWSMPKTHICHRNRLLGGAVCVVVLAMSGCCMIPMATQESCSSSVQGDIGPWTNPQLVFPERLDRGYTIVLPGIWGSQPVDYGIVMGLKDGDVPSAIEMHDWTAGALRLVYNLRALEHNRGEARKIAAKIVAYQDRYPGRPVHLVGYSGGAGVAVLTLEAMPSDRTVTDAILLAPTLASDYDLRLAISHTTHGIRNFYSPLDVPLLMVLTAVVGTTEGQHVPAAGAIGFQRPRQLTSGDLAEYDKLMPQQAYDPSMLLDGHCGGHFGWSNRPFIAHHVAPLLAAPVTPALPLPTATVADEKRTGYAFSGDAARSGLF